MNVEERMTLLQQVQAAIPASGKTFSSLMRPGLSWHPIPYFGNPSTAAIATVGVNPSSTEFSGSRWPTSTLSTQQLDTRLVRYFVNNACPPHQWFDGWEEVLKLLGHSYKTTAVHLDLSPRVTKSMRSADQAVFLRMVRNDMPAFLSLLSGMANTRSLLIAGSVTKSHYMDEFFNRFLPPGYKLSLLQTKWGQRNAV